MIIAAISVATFLASIPIAITCSGYRLSFVHREALHTHIDNMGADELHEKELEMAMALFDETEIRLDNARRAVRTLLKGDSREAFVMDSLLSFELTITKVMGYSLAWSSTAEE